MKMFGYAGNSMRGGASVFFAALITAAMLIQFLSGSAAGQYLAWPPGDRDQGVFNCAPEKCVVYVSWESTGEYDLSANPTEAYIGQPEIQASLEKLKSAIIKAIKKEEDDSPIAQAILKNKPDLFLKQPAALFVSWADVENKKFAAGAVMKLGATEDSAGAVIDALINSESDIEYVPFEVEGAQCYSFDDGWGYIIQFGIVNNYLLVAAGEMKIADLVKNMQTPPPAWLKEIDQRIGIERPSFTSHVDISQWVKIFLQFMEEDNAASEEDSEKVRDVFELLRVSEFETLQYQSGMNSDGFNQVAHLNHASPNEGLMSAFSTETFKEADVAAIPEETSLTFAMKIAPEKILSMTKQIIKKTAPGGLGDYDQAVLDAKERFGFDLEEDLIKSLDGTAFLYTDRSLTSPKVVAAVRVKDPAKFTKFYDSLNIQLEKKLVQSGMDFQKVEKKDQTFFEVKLPNRMQVCYGLVDDTLYLCNSVRGISSHLRKKDRDSGKLIQTPRFLKHFEQGRSDGFKGIVGFSEYDLRQVLEMGLPMAKLMFQNQMDRDVFDFTLDDLPGVEVLVNGLRPSTSLIYRTDTGLAMKGVNDLPLGFDLPTTGIMIGMLLPAVQQTRAAARRVTSLNNLRQLALALLNYESAHGHFPPAYSVDDDGNPLLSWRVAILPFMEQNNLYEQFHLDEPWDSPHNLTLADQMPEVFKHPGLKLKKNQTAYVAPVGKDSILSAGPINETGDGNGFDAITDGTSNTLLLVAVDEENAVDWTSPNDLPYDTMDDDQLADALTGFLDMMETAVGDGATFIFEGDEVEAAGKNKLRGNFNKSDEIHFDFAP